MPSFKTSRPLTLRINERQISRDEYLRFWTKNRLMLILACFQMLLFWNKRAILPIYRVSKRR